jgi:hypothetical protein
VRPAHPCVFAVVQGGDCSVGPSTASSCGFGGGVGFGGSRRRAWFCLSLLQLCAKAELQTRLTVSLMHQDCPVVFCCTHASLSVILNTATLIITQPALFAGMSEPAAVLRCSQPLLLPLRMPLRCAHLFGSSNMARAAVGCQHVALVLHQHLWCWSVTARTDLHWGV